MHFILRLMRVLNAEEEISAPTPQLIVDWRLWIVDWTIQILRELVNRNFQKESADEAGRL